MNLKIGGNNVGKIMYGGQEFGGATKLEPGTILYMSETRVNNLESVHLLSTTKNWSNVDGINITLYTNGFNAFYGEVDISGDDFKNLDIVKKYDIVSYKMTVSRSIVDGEYKLNVDNESSFYYLIKAI
jgi:hypothetical protein